MAKKLILSLDVTEKQKAMDIMNMASSQIAMVKIGHYAVSSFSPLEIKEITKNSEIMLDLKFFDIPNTVLNAIKGYENSLGNVKYFTFNGSMDSKTIQAIANKDSRSEGIAVLVLSSENIQEEEFISKAKYNYNLGIRSFVCPPAYIKLILSELQDKNIKLFSPSVRSIADNSNDHSKTYTSKEAIGLGASYVIVGRPIINASNINEKIKEYL